MCRRDSCPCFSIRHQEPRQLRDSFRAEAHSHQVGRGFEHVSATAIVGFGPGLKAVDERTRLIIH